MKKILSLINLFCILCVNSVSAQTNDPDFFRSTGKIYVSVAVLALIFFGIVAYLINLDKKIGKLEKEVENK